MLLIMRLSEVNDPEGKNIQKRKLMEQCFRVICNSITQGLLHSGSSVLYLILIVSILFVSYERKRDIRCLHTLHIIPVMKTVRETLAYTRNVDIKSVNIVQNFNLLSFGLKRCLENLFASTFL